MPSPQTGIGGSSPLHLWVTTIGPCYVMLWFNGGGREVTHSGRWGWASEAALLRIRGGVHRAILQGRNSKDLYPWLAGRIREKNKGFLGAAPVPALRRATLSTPGALVAVSGGDTDEPRAAALPTRYLGSGPACTSWDSLETVFCSRRQVSFGRGFIFLRGQRESRGKGRSHKVSSDRGRWGFRAETQTSPA